MSTIPTNRDSDRFMLRLPDGMRDRIKDAAHTNNRSMNAEIVATLEERYPAEKPTDELLKKHHELSMRVIRGLVPASEMDGVRAQLESLYEELLKRRDHDFPDGPLPMSDSEKRS